jgi:DNA-binding NtrC family response regulator
MKRPDAYPKREGNYPAGGLEKLKASAGELLVTLSPAMQELRALVDRLAPSQATVLVTGEPGTGKGLVVRAIHEASPRALAPLITLDCRATPGEHFEEWLFGASAFASGSFSPLSGAVQRVGQGSLFLREIALIPLLVQPRVLRWLDDGEPLGPDPRVGRRAARLLASSSADLARAVAAGTFRADLAERLGLVVVRVPALRERAEDLPELVRVLLRALSSPGCTPPPVSPAALQALARRSLPGNVRELRERLAAGLVQAREGGSLEPAHLEWP